MLIGYDIPSSVSVAIGGTGASIDTSASLLFDGFPAQPTRFTWNSDTPAIASTVTLTFTWTGAIKPRVLCFVGTDLPTGLKCETRLDDGAGNYTVDPGGNADQRLVTLADGNVALWQAWPQPSSAVEGFRVTLYNDVGGSTALTASQEFEIGEVFFSPAVVLPLERGWQEVVVDPTEMRRSTGAQPWPLVRTPYRAITGQLVPTHVDDIKGQALDNNQDWSRVMAALQGRSLAACLPRYTDSAGAYDGDIIGRDALLGITSQAGEYQHEAGDYFRGRWRFEEVPP